MNNTFEDQLTASARRLREAQDAKLHVAASPEITHSPTHLLSENSNLWHWQSRQIFRATKATNENHSPGKACSNWQPNNWTEPSPILHRT